MAYNFDQIVDRRNSDSAKWKVYGADVVPLWVADMDFESPAPIRQALVERVQHNVFGYGWDSANLRNVLVERMQNRYHWSIRPSVGSTLSHAPLAKPAMGFWSTPLSIHPFFLLRPIKEKWSKLRTKLRRYTMAICTTRSTLIALHRRFKPIPSSLFSATHTIQPVVPTRPVSCNRWARSA